MLFSPMDLYATIYCLPTMRARLVMYLYIYFCNWICFFAQLPVVRVDESTCTHLKLLPLTHATD
jgi:hypothetical protein